ncbi:MAG: SDR family oxidoreductase [Sphingomonadaceae bacterium]|nr:SDR family oxidoreductase [Sphingomonadaceae bacterium]
MELNLRDKRVLVTGGDGGLGSAMAEAFAAEGARVAINYRGEPDIAERMAADFKAVGADALAVEADVTDADGIAAMFGRLDEAWGGIDVLLNNAGIDGKAGKGWEIAVEDWTRVIDVNLKGAFLCAREALRRMVKQRAGVIVSTSSVHELIAWSGYSAYTASKAGLAMLTKTLAQEAAPHGVRVLAIAPGAIRTPINRSVWSEPEGMRDLLTKIPLGRIGEPEDVANMALVLASDLAAYVTGTTIFVDGGMTDYPEFAHGG